MSPTGLPSPRRKPLTDLSISPSKKSKPASMENVILSTVRKKGWPNWTPSVSKGAAIEPPSQLFFTIKMDSRTRAYVPIDDDKPEEIFQKAMTFFKNIREKINYKGDDGIKIVSQVLTRELINVIFGSNAIERAGLGLDETVKICERIFRGEVVDPEEIPERDMQYEKKLISTVRPNFPASHIIRRQREVVQHALALQYITVEVVAKDHLLSEEIIFETHRILTHMIDAPGGMPWTEYSGRYRNVHVHAGNTNFVTPHFIPHKMRELIQEFNSDIREAEHDKVLDPFMLAAKYCNDFVMIHPFVDGNGRMCRLILNAILLRYAGVVVALGEHDESREEYLAIQQRAGEQMDGSGELSALVLNKAKAKYRTMKQKLTGKK